MRIDEQYINDVCVDLVQIDSRNPSLTPDGPGEERIGERVVSYLNDLGCQVSVHRLAPGRTNVVGILPGRGGGRSLLINGHLDTVGVEGMKNPFSGRVEKGRLYGRGSQDMKGSLAAMLAAGKALVDENAILDGDLILAFVADEEDSSLGTRELVKHYTADGAIVTEPTDMKLVLAHRGLAWYRVETVGKAAHGSRFWEGVDAIMSMGKFLNRLSDLETELTNRPGHPLTGPPSLHAGTIQGGTDICTYPSRCVLEIDRRTIPGENQKNVRKEMENILEITSLEDPAFQGRIDQILWRPALETSPESGLLHAVQEAYQQVLGKQPELTGAAYWSDAALLAEAGMEALLVGPVGDGLHSDQEWVEIASLGELAGVLAETARRYCIES